MSQMLFDALDEMSTRLRSAPRCLLCLDYDGTLAPFVADPHDAHMPPATERVLRALAAHEDVHAWRS